MIFFIIFILCIFLIICWLLKSPENNQILYENNINHKIENFYVPLHDYDYGYSTIPFYDTHSNFLFLNTQLGSKRNSSYDLRGYMPIYKHHFIPFNMGTRIPILNKPLYMVS